MSAKRGEEQSSRKGTGLPLRQRGGIGSYNWKSKPTRHKREKRGKEERTDAAKEDETAATLVLGTLRGGDSRHQRILRGLDDFMKAHLRKAEKEWDVILLTSQSASTSTRGENWGLESGEM